MFKSLISHAWKSWVLHNLKNIARSIFVSKLQSPDDTFSWKRFFVLYQRHKRQTKIKKCNSYNVADFRLEIVTEGGCTYSDQLDNRATMIGNWSPVIIDFYPKSKVKYLIKVKKRSISQAWSVSLYSERIVKHSKSEARMSHWRWDPWRWVISRSRLPRNYCKKF